MIENYTVDYSQSLLTDEQLLARFAVAILAGGRPPYDIRADVVSENVYMLAEWMLKRHKETAAKYKGK